MHVPAGRAAHILGTALLLLPVLLAPPARAFERLQLQLGAVSGDSWSADGLSASVDWLENGRFAATLQAARARFPVPLGELRDLVLECPSLTYDGGELVCEQGSLRAVSARLGPQRLTLSLRYRLTDRNLRLALRGLRYLGGELALQAGYTERGWQATVDAQRLTWAALLQEARVLGYPVVPLEGDGTVSGRVQLQGRGSGVGSVSLDARLTSPSFSTQAGNLAGENLALEVNLQARARGAGWHVELDGRFPEGALYVEPVYLEAGAQPLVLHTRFDWQPRANRVVLDALEFLHPEVLAVSATGRLGFGPEPLVEALEASVSLCRMPGCYTGYLQPWLHGSLGGQLDTGGELEARLQLDAGQPREVQVDLHRLDVRDTQGRFGFEGLTGRVDWAAQGAMRRSRLGWDGGQVYRLALGPAQLAVESGADRLRLLEPAVLPVLDGELQLDSLEVERPAGQELRWAVAGILTPVSMPALTAALGWPEFGGKLSGVIPSVRYAGGELSVGGVLLVRVFDGEVTLRDVRLADPFGPVPRLRLTARADGIDLDALTRTFSFGRIEGRLDGYVNDLVMESWRPVAFDAGFATPAGDRSRHRISQKAVDSISNIGGGGMSGALSRSLLGFFEDFPYARLGLFCRLANGICEMRGVEPAERGYYIVKGRFLPPRLDVVGFADRVNWNQLVAQVSAVTGGQGAAVK